MTRRATAPGRWALLALALLLPGAARAQTLPPLDPGIVATRFDSARAATILTAAFAFMLPRTLDPATPRDLALWGLDGLPALDPRLSTVVRGNEIEVRLGAKPLLSRHAPDTDDAPGWASLAASLADAGWAASPALRAAGPQAIISSFFDELFNHFDPYSRYAPPAEGSRQTAWLEGSAGLGVELGSLGGWAVIAHVKDDGPAAEAGLRPGEAIEAVDGQSTRGQTPDTVARWLAGPEDTDTVLRVRAASGRVREQRVARRIVTPETVYAQTIPAGRAGTWLNLRITGFTHDTDRRVETELLRALRDPGHARPPAGLILDLRGNRGGLLRQAAQTADLMLGGGVVAVTEGRDPEASTTWQSRPDDITDGLPLVVLVDGRTASAAEILAAALQDHGRAVLIGSATLGKGLVQTVTTLPDGGALYVTWSRVLAPAGYPLQALGVLPQICTALGSGALAGQMRDLAADRLDMLPALLRHATIRPGAAPATILGIRAACPAAEGREQDMLTARRLLATPALYRAARLALTPPPP